MEGSEDDVRISRPEELESARSGGPGVLDSLKLLAAESSATRSSAIILGLNAIVACLPGASKTIFIIQPVNQSIVIGGTQNDSCLPHCMLHSPAVCMYVRPKKVDMDMGRCGYGYGHSQLWIWISPQLMMDMDTCTAAAALKRACNRASTKNSTGASDTGAAVRCCPVLCCNADALHHALRDRLQPQPSLTSDKQLIAYDDRRWMDVSMASKHTSVHRPQQAVSASIFGSNPAMTRMKQIRLTLRCFLHGQW